MLILHSPTEVKLANYLKTHILIPDFKNTFEKRNFHKRIRDDQTSNQHTISNFILFLLTLTQLYL